MVRTVRGEREGRVVGVPVLMPIVNVAPLGTWLGWRMGVVGGSSVVLHLFVMRVVSGEGLRNRNTMH